MDTPSDIAKSTKESLGFFKYVFNFDEENKSKMLNMLQYGFMAVIPAMLILKAVKHFVPEEDDSKGSIEVTFECIAQIAFIFMAIWFSDKAIRFVPTYSDTEYVGLDATSFLMPFLVILLTMQTKLGAKINILIERVMDAYHGHSDDAVPVKQGGNKVNVSQPLAGQHQPSQADYMDHSQLLPSMPGGTGMPSVGQQPSPDFNQMYQQNTTPMPGASAPGGDAMYMDQGPMAANMALGGGSFSSW